MLFGILMGYPIRQSRFVMSWIAGGGWKTGALAWTLFKQSIM